MLLFPISPHKSKYQFLLQYSNLLKKYGTSPENFLYLFRSKTSFKRIASCFFASRCLLESGLEDIIYQCRPKFGCTDC